MKFSNLLIICICFFFLITNIYSSPHSQEVEKDFNIKPEGNKDTTSIELGDYICEFTYAATGGSNENWKINMNKEDDMIICNIGRNTYSYLLFKDFTITLKNKKTGKSNFNPEILDNNGSILIDDQYTIKNGNVVPTNSFGGNLVFITLTMKI